MDKQTESRLGFLGGGLLLGGAFIAAQDTLAAMSPWLVGAIWLITFGIVVYGLGGLGWSRLMRGAITLVLLWMTFAFWQATTNHADIHVEDIVLLPKDKQSAGEIAINVVFGNAGKASADYVQASNQNFVPSIADGVARRPLEDRYFSALNNFFLKNPGHPSIELIPGRADGRFTTLTIAASPQEQADFDAGKILILVVGQFRYKDWWFQEQTTDYCGFVGAKTSMIWCSRYNGPR